MQKKKYVKKKNIECRHIALRFNQLWCISGVGVRIRKCGSIGC